MPESDDRRPEPELGGFANIVFGGALVAMSLPIVVFLAVNAGNADGHLPVALALAALAVALVGAGVYLMVRRPFR